MRMNMHTTVKEHWSTTKVYTDSQQKPKQALSSMEILRTVPVDGGDDLAEATLCEHTADWKDLKCTGTICRL
jgi:hypothetical protein